MHNTRKDSASICSMENIPAIKTLMEELKTGLSLYWETAAGILRQSGVTLQAPQEDYFSLKNNFFSLLFLYSFDRAGIPESRRILYGATLQCLRGMVTGCDNLLDDEYKKTLDTDIPKTGVRFRSVIDIMVSDRVLFQILLEACHQQDIKEDRVVAATTASMKTMIRSGVQEASEEAGINSVLKPDELLRTIHHYKTGILFKCPWDIPLAIENFYESDVAPLLDALYRIGMGCQIMDDMVDFTSDLERKRHNFLVSSIYHGPHSIEKDRLQELVTSGAQSKLTADLAKDFPDSLSKAFKTSHQFLESGLKILLSEQHQLLLEPSIRFLEERIGVSHLTGKLRG